MPSVCNVTHERWGVTCTVRGPHETHRVMQRERKTTSRQQGVVGCYSWPNDKELTSRT